LSGNPFLALIAFRRNCAILRPLNTQRRKCVAFLAVSSVIEPWSIILEKGLFMPKMMKNYKEPTHEEITVLAQRFYEAEGRPEGKAMEHWLRAEAQLVSERKEKAMSQKPGAPKIIPNSPKIGVIAPSPGVLSSSGRQDLRKN
jgi:DUF2934 family protein